MHERVGDVAAVGDVVGAEVEVDDSGGERGGLVEITNLES